MKLTVGPLSPAVYWRRRAVVAIPLLILGLVGSCMASGDGADDAPASLTVAQPPADEPADEPTAPSPSDPTPSASDTPPATATFPPSSTAVPTVTVVPSSPPSSVAVAAPVKPVAPGPCADTDLSLVAGTGSPRYRLGQYPRLTLVVTNASTRPCYQDVGAGQQELRVFWSTTRVWSSDDCAAPSGSNRQLLVPGEKRTYFQTWNGRRSRPGCAPAGSAVGPGSYQVVGRLGTLSSRPASFTIVR